MGHLHSQRKREERKGEDRYRADERIKGVIGREQKKEEKSVVRAAKAKTHFLNDR